jgi:hypothetical protein
MRSTPSCARRSRRQTESVQQLEERVAKIDEYAAEHEEKRAAAQHGARRGACRRRRSAPSARRS